MTAKWYNVNNPDHVIAVVTGGEANPAKAVYWLHDKRTINHYADMGVQVVSKRYKGVPLTIEEFGQNWRCPYFWPPHKHCIGGRFWRDVT